MITQQNPRAKGQAKSASTEPAKTSNSQQSPMAPSHRPTLQHYPTSETLHNTGKCWLSQLCFKATPGRELAASWDMPLPPSWHSSKLKKGVPYNLPPNLSRTDVALNVSKISQRRAGLLGPSRGFFTYSHQHTDASFLPSCPHHPARLLQTSSCLCTAVPARKQVGLTLVMR